MEIQYVIDLFNQNQQLQNDIENLKNELFNERLQSLELLFTNKKLKDHACNSIDYCMYPCNKYYEWVKVGGKKGHDI